MSRPDRRDPKSTARTSGSVQPFASRPLARLADLAGQLPSLPAGAAANPAADVSSAPATPLSRALASRIVVSRDARGRGGKTVTFARGIAGTPELLEALAKELRHELGTGVRAVDGELIVQGALTERLAACLAKRGAKRIVIGN
jgi:translation initiation factor 1